MNARKYLDTIASYQMRQLKLLDLGILLIEDSSLYEYLKKLSFDDNEILKSNLVKKD